MIPLLSEHSNNISLNEKLFQRVKAVYKQKSKLSLTIEQAKLLDDIYDGFVRRGANLQGEARNKYRELSKKLSTLTLQFGENNLKETNNFQLVLTQKEQLAGLPEGIVEAAAQTAREKGVEGWVITLHAPSYVPFMTYASNRELRKELYMAYNTKCTKNNEFNTLEIVKDLVNTRMQIAQLLGYKSYADYTLKERMAESSKNVYKIKMDLEMNELKRNESFFFRFIIILLSFWLFGYLLCSIIPCIFISMLVRFLFLKPI